MSFEKYGPSREVTGFTLKWILWGGLIVIVLVVIAWGLGWLFLPGQVVSPQNVREQWRFAYEYDEKLQAAAVQVCATEKALNSATSDNERQQRRSQLLAYEQNYAKIKAEFDARLRDAFQAKLVAPADIPREASTLDAMKRQACQS